MILELISINNTKIACYHQKFSSADNKNKLPPIVLVHGYSGTALHHFKYEIENYSRIFQTDVLAYDHRGHGNSETGDCETLDDDIYLKDFEELIKYFNFEEVILIGASFGGVLANRYTLKYPEKVKKLILISTTAESTPGMLNALRDITTIINNFIAYDYDSKRLDPQSMKFLSVLLKIHHEKYPYNKFLCFRHFINIFLEKKFSLLEEIKNTITCPVLILHGNVDYVELENAKKMDSYFQNSKLIIIPNLGHLPQRKNPLLVEEYISEFLEASN